MRKLNRINESIKKLKFNRKYGILIGLLLLVISEYLASSYQYKSLVNRIYESENILISYNEIYRPFPQMSKEIEYFSSGLGSLEVTKYKYIKLNGNLVSSTSSTEAWNAWREDMQSIALIKKNKLLEKQFDIEQIDIFPWRTNKQIAKEKYIEHTETWIMYLSSLIDANQNSELNSFFEDDFGISPSFTIAKKALNNGVPTLDLFRIESQIKVIFSKEE